MKAATHRFVATLIVVLAGCATDTTGNTPDRTSPRGDEENRKNDTPAEDQFQVIIGGQAQQTPAPAIVAVSYRGDIEPEIELQFEVGSAPRASSLVARVPYSLFERRMAEVPVRAEGANATGCDLFIHGVQAREGTLSVSLDTADQLSGSVKDGDDSFEFKGKYVLTCAVLPSAVQGSDVEAPVPDEPGARPVLVVDTEFGSEQCRALQRTLNL